MTESLIQKIEEKVMALMTELEQLRKEHTQVKHENAAMKADKQDAAKKMQGLISLLDTLESSSDSVISFESHAKEDYATA